MCEMIFPVHREFKRFRLESFEFSLLPIPVASGHVHGQVRVQNKDDNANFSKFGLRKFKCSQDKFTSA